MSELPIKLNINENFEITESLSLNGVERVLLEPSKCYLNDNIVQLERIIKAMVYRYNKYNIVEERENISPIAGIMGIGD